MKKLTLYTIGLNSYITTRNEIKVVEGEFTPQQEKGEGVEFSFMMAEHENPVKIKEALSEIIHELQTNIADIAEEICNRNKLKNFIDRGGYDRDDVMNILDGMPNYE